MFFYAGQNRLVPGAALLGDRHRPDAGGVLVGTGWHHLGRRLLIGGLAALLVLRAVAAERRADRAAREPVPAPGPGQRRPVTGIIVLGGAEDARAIRRASWPGSTRPPSASPRPSLWPAASPRRAWYSPAARRRCCDRAARVGHHGAAAGGAGRCRGSASRSRAARATPTRTPCSPSACRSRARASAGCSSPRDGTCRARSAAFARPAFRSSPGRSTTAPAAGSSSGSRPTSPRAAANGFHHAGVCRAVMYYLTGRTGALLPGP